MSSTESAAGEAWSRLLRRMAWAFVRLLASIALFVTIIMGHHNAQEIRTATTTLATIDDCQSEGYALTLHGFRKDEIICTGTWSFGGRRDHGDIVGLEEMLPAGAQVQVKANGGSTAYTPTYTDMSYLPAYLVAGLLAVVAAVYVRETRWERRRRNRLRHRPDEAS